MPKNCEPRVEVPEVTSAEQRCFIVLTFFSADSEEISAVQMWISAVSEEISAVQLWISAVSEKIRNSYRILGEAVVAETDWWRNTASCWRDSTLKELTFFHWGGLSIDRVFNISRPRHEEHELIDLLNEHQNGIYPLHPHTNPCWIAYGYPTKTTHQYPVETTFVPHQNGFCTHCGRIFREPWDNEVL